MKKLLWIFIVASLVLVGCGKDKDDNKAGEQTAKLIAPEQASTYLLTLEDMPSGWSQQPDDEEDNTDDERNVICLEGDNTPKAQNNVSVDFKADTFGPFLTQSVGVFETVGDAKAEMSAYNVAVDQCRTWTETNEDGEETTYTLSRLSFDSYGDESFAVRMGLDMGEGDVVYFRKGNVVVTVAYITVAIAGPQDSIFEEMAGKAVGKFE